MKNTANTPSIKKAYEKPELKSFSLKADEVMAGTCKVDAVGSTGPDGSPCQASNCQQAGS